MKQIDWVEEQEKKEEEWNKTVEWIEEMMGEPFYFTKLREETPFEKRKEEISKTMDRMNSVWFKKMLKKNSR